MGVKAEIEDIREINIRREGGRRMVVVELRDMEGKRGNEEEESTKRKKRKNRG